MNTKFEFKESDIFELKREFTGDVKNKIIKTLIAFANTKGGTLYIGIDDDGTLVGVQNAEEILMNLNNAIRDSVSPYVTLFMSTKVEQILGKDIIAINIARGSEPPYYLKGKGISPDGVFIRQGSSSVDFKNFKSLSR